MALETVKKWSEELKKNQHPAWELFSDALKRNYCPEFLASAAELLVQAAKIDAELKSKHEQAVIAALLQEQPVESELQKGATNGAEEPAAEDGGT